MFLKITDGKQQKDRADEREDRGDEHPRPHPDLLGRKSKHRTQLGGERSDRDTVDHHTHQLGGRRSAKVTAGRHQGEGGYARVGDFFFHHNQHTRPEHRGEEPRQHAGNKRGHRAHGQTRNKIASKRADHTDKKHRRDAFPEFGVRDTHQPQKDGKARHAEDVAERLINMQGVLHEAGDPVGHRIFGTAAEEDAAHAKEKPKVAVLRACRSAYRFPAAHFGHRRDHKQDRGQDRERGEEERQVHPIFRREEGKEQRADHHDEENAEGVQRMQKAHIPLRIVGRDGGDHRAEQHLRKPRRDRENDRADKQPRIGILREQGGHECVDRQPHCGDQGHRAHDPFDVKPTRKEGKEQVDRQLGTKVRQHQRAEQGVGNVVHIVQGHEQKRGQAEHRGHGKVGGVAGKFGSFETVLGRVHFYSP